MRKIQMLAATWIVAALGCSPGASLSSGAITPTTTNLAGRSAPESEPSAIPKEHLPWADFTPETFAKAKRERRYIVLDNSAEWCHWCHVMEATTYHDPRVRQLLERHFIAVKVDVDARPDLEERYGDWGWPATVIFSPDAQELGKYRGYLAPEKFIGILQEVVDSRVAQTGKVPQPAKRPRVADGPLSDEHVAWIAQSIETELEEYWDEQQGSWGRTQKAPLYWDNAWMLFRAKSGDEEARRKAVFTLEKQRPLLDPVWGGIYQYSAASDWDHAHFEKLMTFNAGALDNYAAAFALTRDGRFLADARKVQSYLENFLRSPQGGFYATQDADLNAHELGKRFMDGHAYYALDDAGRRKAGIPRIDTHEYARENGLAIAAYCTLFEATRDPAVLATAEQAAKRILDSHMSPRGGLTHDAKPDDKVLHLGDNAAMGFALMRLHEVTLNPAYLASAKRVAAFMRSELEDAAGGGFFASTADPDAVGVFESRRVPVEENVMALRFLARLAHATPDSALETTIRKAIRGVYTPEQIKSRGRMLGDLLLALEVTRGVR